MKIAVLSDIHGNFVALQAVFEHIEAWRPDHTIVAGDIVNRGPRSKDCLEWIQNKERRAGWQVVRGNHEDYVISHDLPGAPRSGPAFEVHRGSFWTYQQLGCDVSALKAMPFQQKLFGPNGDEIRIVHASMRGNRVGIYPESCDAKLKSLIEPAPVVLCVGHTHRPLVRRLNGSLIVNAGSAGLPFDGDTRPSYAQLTWVKEEWRAEIIRVEYDLSAAERDFYESGFINEAGPLAQLVLIELRQACSQLFQWASQYQEMAMAGEISMQDAVQDFLS
jgi:predicted phosphodiesterase